MDGDSAMFSSVLGGAEPASFAEATLNGWAPDGGMYWPTTIEPVTQETLVAWGGLSYPRLCEEVLKRFIRADDPDISRAELASIVSSAFDAFGSNSVLQLQPLTDGDGEGELHVVELWHGPTLAFKDLGMSVLGRVLRHLLRRRRERLMLLVGTSGDTGSSAMEAVRGAAQLHPHPHRHPHLHRGPEPDPDPNPSPDQVRGLAGIDILVLYPLQGFSSISPVQEMQMTAVAEAASNVHLMGVEGGSDDLDVPLERLFCEPAFKAKHRLGSVNSVNVVRLLVQAVHYFYAYCRLAPAADRVVRFAVPCGAGGHLASGLLALQMGLPAKLIAATNANDALHRLLSSGVLSRGASSVAQTASPSMDIQVRALPCHALPCPAVPCPALPCPALPCRALPCRALALPCRTCP